MHIHIHYYLYVNYVLQVLTFKYRISNTNVQNINDSHYLIYYVALLYKGYFLFYILLYVIYKYVYT